jgi:hypothetical protein
MATFNEKFGKYSVTMETDMNEEPTTGCWISYRTRTREYTASLECALATGELTANDGYVHDMESAIIDDIEQWAIENGY